MRSGSTSPPVEEGALIDSYRILHLAAEGGMGVVYRALDTKLDRQVAIKFLPAELADAQARRRFQREAQLASSLNHPHLLSVYDVGEFDGFQYLVMEWVDGGTLRDWSAETHPSWQLIVETLIGVADGIATAHDAGILHRDIKPGNVLMVKSGYAKLADFGIAKLADHARTAAGDVTRTDVLVGSPGYMSPEQVTGAPLDGRSDIFSFGIILHELLSGERPFSGNSGIDVAYAVLHTLPPALPDDIPLALRMVVGKSLEKDPADRYQNMRDLVVDLRRIARRQVEELRELPGADAQRSRRRRQLAGLASIALLAVILGAWAGSVWSPPAAPTGAPLSVAFSRVTDFVGLEEMPAASPDGKTVAFTVSLGAQTQIWVRMLAGGAPLQITHDPVEHSHPRWISDASLIYFVPAAGDSNVGSLWEVSALGGAPRRVAPALGGADVSHDGRRIAAFQPEAGATVLAILGRDGSRTEPVIRLPPHVAFETPRWSPDDRSVAFVANAGGFRRAIYVTDTAGGAPRVLARANDILGVTWVPDGSGLVYASSQGSVLSYPPVFNLHRVSLDGQVVQLTVGEISYTYPEMARPGKLFATRTRMESDIWRFPVAGSPAANTAGGERLTWQTGQVQTPSVSPDGEEIAYLSDSGGHSNVWIARLDGSGVRQLTFERDPDVLIGIPNWSPAGDRIVYVRTDRSGSFEWLVNPDGSGTSRLVSGVAASFSRDGAWLYYADSGVDAECIRKVAIDGGSEQLVRCGAANPIISGDGGTLYFSPSVSRQNELMKATPEDGPAVAFAAYAPSRIPAWPTGYALSPDGQWLAVPLKDGRTTNIWGIPTESGPFRQITDFGNRPTIIARQVSWSADGRFVYAAVAECDADVIVFEEFP